MGGSHLHRLSSAFIFFTAPVLRMRSKTGQRLRRMRRPPSSRQPEAKMLAVFILYNWYICSREGTNALNYIYCVLYNISIYIQTHLPADKTRATKPSQS